MWVDESAELLRLSRLVVDYRKKDLPSPVLLPWLLPKVLWSWSSRDNPTKIVGSFKPGNRSLGPIQLLSQQVHLRDFLQRNRRAWKDTRVAAATARRARDAAALRWHLDASRTSKNASHLLQAHVNRRVALVSRQGRNCIQFHHISLSFLQQTPKQRLALGDC